MPLFYVHLFKSRDQSPPSPQKNTVNPSQKESKPDQDVLSKNAHTKAVEHLHDVKTNYSLERRLFW
ncbi:MAG: hypothetical protein HC769_32830 [Cyanobacteria bacterium CRU_2_1]|nr:hypothetical protein [Cyanobacteria bacterium RU_5_0]NJR63148.1 hypothetical protein [Cyanobacteria bacterium CRU_2_1]